MEKIIESPKMSAEEMEVRKAIYRQWDKQVVEMRINQSYIQLNNLYLMVESGKVEMSLKVREELYRLLGIVYPHQTETIMADYWEGEFEKLNNWLDF